MYIAQLFPVVLYLNIGNIQRKSEKKKGKEERKRKI